MKCNCGCNKEAKWLLTFYDPTLWGHPMAYEREMPACESYKRYCGENCAEFDLPFIAKPVEVPRGR